MSSPSPNYGFSFQSLEVLFIFYLIFCFEIIMMIISSHNVVRKFFTCILLAWQYLLTNFNSRSFYFCWQHMRNQYCTKYPTLKKQNCALHLLWHTMLDSNFPLSNLSNVLNQFTNLMWNLFLVAKFVHFVLGHAAQFFPIHNFYIFGLINAHYSYWHNQYHKLSIFNSKFQLEGLFQQ